MPTSSFRITPFRSLPKPCGTRPTACFSLRHLVCFCFPAPHTWGQPLMRLLIGHCGTATPHRPFPPITHSTGPRKEQRAVSLQPEKLVLGTWSGSSIGEPHLRQKAAGTESRGNSRTQGWPSCTLGTAATSAESALWTWSQARPV